MAFNVPEQYRVKRGPMASDVSFGNNGMFVIPSMGGSIRIHYQCQASDAAGDDVKAVLDVVAPSNGVYWEHVSISVINISHSGHTKIEPRCPTWEEMCYIKNLFWDDPEDMVIQIHPPESEYVSVHRYCLHLWRPVDKEGKPIALPRPNPSFVGDQLKKDEPKPQEDELKQS